MWPAIRKHVLSTKAFSRGFEVALKPFGNGVSEGLKPFGKLFETLWNSLETLLKHFENPFEMPWNSLETLLKPFRNALKPFRTYKIIYYYGSNTLPKPALKVSREKYSPNLHSLRTYWQMRDSTTCYEIFLQKCIFLSHASVLIYLWLLKDQKI